MRPTLRGKLCVPAFLAVTAVGAPGCAEKPTTTTTESDATAGTESDTRPTTTATPTTGTTSGTDTGTTTGDLPACHTLADKAACDSEPACFWFAETLQCVIDCDQIKDQATCTMQMACSWFDEMCELVVE